jgi:hypothetical protein
MAKTAVYSWRVEPELKAELEARARREGRSLAELLEEISRDWLRESQSAGDAEEQARLRAAAERFAGTVEIDDPDLSARVRERVRERLMRGHGA